MKNCFLAGIALLLVAVLPVEVDSMFKVRLIPTLGSIFLDAIAEEETGHLPEKERSTAVSPKGALGKYQVKPETAQWLSEQPGSKCDPNLPYYDPNSRRCAWEFVVYCEGALKRKRLGLSKLQISWCYNSGYAVSLSRVPKSQSFPWRVSYRATRLQMAVLIYHTNDTEYVVITVTSI